MAPIAITMSILSDALETRSLIVDAEASSGLCDGAMEEDLLGWSEGNCDGDPEGFVEEGHVVCGEIEGAIDGMIEGREEGITVGSPVKGLNDGSAVVG